MSYPERHNDVESEANKIAIMIRASRSNYKNVAANLVKSLQKFGHTDRYKLSLYISADEKITRDVFRLREDIESKFASVRYIFDKDRRAILSKISDCNIAPKSLTEIIVLQKPYGYQINSALIYAISDGNQMALHFDDDQGFAVPVESPESGLKWIYMDIIGWHIRSLQQGATVTTGPIAGCVSPIPQQITMIVPEAIRRELGRLFEDGHEFVDRDTFLCPRFRILTQLESESNEGVNVPERQGYRWISPANMGINLQIPFPVFYNPKGARGEDAFFAMSLDPLATLIKIPAFIFHDPFLSHPEIYENRFPSHLTDEPVSPQSINRLANAILGWIRYMPLFLRIRLNDNRDVYTSMIQKKRKIIEGIAEELSWYLQCRHLLKMARCLDVYDQRVEIDYKNWLEVNSIWRERILPWLQECHPKFDAK